MNVVPERRKYSKGSIAAVIAALVVSVTFGASQYTGVFDGDSSMDKQEVEIAETLEEINSQTTGVHRDVVIDCGISAIEEIFIAKDSGGWALSGLPGFNPKVLHLRSEFCNGFSESDPMTIAKSLFAFNYTVYGYPADHPCSMKIADEQYPEALDKVYGDKPKEGEEFTKFLVSYVAQEDDCPKTISELVEKD